MVAGLSGVSGCSRARSVRRVSASTKASNRSSLLPAEPYRPRRFFTWFGLITTTVSPASSSASTTGPSGRSMATSPTPVRASIVEQLAQSGGGVLDGASADFAAAGVDDRHRVIVAGPVDAGGHTVGGFRRAGCFWQTSSSASSLLVPVGRHPVWCRDAAAGSLTDRRSTALSPVDGRHAPGNRRVLAELMLDVNASSEQGDDPAAPRVHRQPIQDHRHNDGAPVNPLSRSPTHGWCTMSTVWIIAAVMLSAAAAITMFRIWRGRARWTGWSRWTPSSR